VATEQDATQRFAANNDADRARENITTKTPLPKESKTIEGLIFTIPMLDTIPFIVHPLVDVS
jgi:hypothetical protein